MIDVPNVASSLEPLASTALAVNLAYLGLVRFRYRDQIRKSAEAERRIFEPSDKPVPENIKQMKLYRQLCDLCILSNYDADDIAGAKRDAKISGGLWPWIYNNIYRSHRDRYAAYICSFAAGLTLSASVAFKIDTWYYVAYLYYQSVGWVWLYLLIFACFCPVGLVWMGRKIVYHTTNSARECREEIEKAMQSNLQNTAVPAQVQAAAPTATA